MPLAVLLEPKEFDCVVEGLHVFGLVLVDVIVVAAVGEKLVNCLRSDFIIVPTANTLTSTIPAPAMNVSMYE